MSPLSNIVSPIIFKGDETSAYRDPALWYEKGVFYLFFTYVDNSEGGPYLSLASSRSNDLANWTPMELLTGRDKSLNFSSPGNIIKKEGRYYLCLQTYPRENGEKYGNKNSRVFLMESDDLISWSKPKVLALKGDTAIEALGRMIDPYIVEDRENKGEYLCFYKQNGATFSRSRDLLHWEQSGQIDCGENVCVIEKDDQYLVFHSPHNGIGVLCSKDLKTFEPYCDDIILGQENWLWAKGRITAGFVLDLTSDHEFQSYLLFFHGSGPEDESVDFDKNGSIGIAWSRDLKNWEWPGSRTHFH